MKEELFKNIKVAAYFLWEYTKFENALNLWCCAEDISYYLSAEGLNSFEKIISIIESNKYYDRYLDFIRNISYRIYAYTGNSRAKENWFTAEKLFRNYECIRAFASAAKIFENDFLNNDMIKVIRSQHVKNCLKGK